MSSPNYVLNKWRDNQFTLEDEATDNTIQTRTQNQHTNTQPIQNVTPTHTIKSRKRRIRIDNPDSSKK